MWFAITIDALPLGGRIRKESADALTRCTRMVLAGPMRLSLVSYLMSLIRARHFVVRGASMEPDFRDGDCLLVDRRAYGRRSPERCEAVILRLPHDEQAYLKRIVGLPGEWVRLESEAVIVNGKAISEPYLAHRSIPQEFVGQEWYLGPDDYLVLGDTRRDSFDSRRFGPVSVEQLVGPVLFRYWPSSRLASIRG